MEMCVLSIWLHSPPPLHLHLLYHPQKSGPCPFILPELLLLRCPGLVCCALPIVCNGLQSFPVFLEPFYYQDCSSSSGIFSVSSTLCFSIPWGSLCGPLFLAYVHCLGISSTFKAAPYHPGDDISQIKFSRPERSPKH